MKNVGSFFEYEECRNADLMRAYKIQLCSKENTNMDQVFTKLVEMPSKRFWVSEERASIVMSNIKRGDRLYGMRPMKREMYFEIYRRVETLSKSRPGVSLYNLTFEIVGSPAPKFYLTPGSAKVIVNKVKKQWYEERKRKYRHLFM